MRFIDLSLEKFLEKHATADRRFRCPLFWEKVNESGLRTVEVRFFTEIIFFSERRAQLSSLFFDFSTFSRVKNPLWKVRHEPRYQRDPTLRPDFSYALESFFSVWSSDSSLPSIQLLQRPSFAPLLRCPWAPGRTITTPNASWWQGARLLISPQY